MHSIIEYLESFNRKERFSLVGNALDNPSFHLGELFRRKVNDSLNVAIPDDAFVAMDYHLDWIHASLYLTAAAEENQSAYQNRDGIATGTQEDIDLIVGFEDNGITNLLLFEAKAETGWTNKQMISKSRRLRGIFGEHGSRYPSVKPYFTLLSPHPPSRLDVNIWPQWMCPSGKPTWLGLTVPPGRRRLIRCDEKSRNSHKGEFFKVPIRGR